MLDCVSIIQIANRHCFVSVGFLLVIISFKSGQQMVEQHLTLRSKKMGSKKVSVKRSQYSLRHSANESAASSRQVTLFLHLVADYKTQ